ncbi:trypsin-like peptidase domain-containing protein [archaeon]|nr:trypsin-like peptidase domain-containing protein [archaeon]
MSLKKAGYVLLASGLGVIGSYGAYWQNNNNRKQEELILNQREQIQNLEEEFSLLKNSQISSIKTVKDIFEAVNNSNANLEERLDFLTKLFYGMDSLQSSKIDFLTGRFDVIKKNVEINNSEIAELRQKSGQLDVAIHGMRLSKDLFVDLNKMYEETISPVIRITDGISSGSGVVVYSKPDLNNQYHTFILTVNHVVEDITPNDQTRVQDFLKNGIIRGIYLPNVIAKKPSADLAIIEVVAPLQMKTAKLIPKYKINYLRLYENVCAVGCPLGYPPLPTTGILSSVNTRLEGENYWMITSPTAPGNSGGGVFLSETNELVGITSKVAGFQNPWPNLIAHMGLMVSPESIYQFLDENNLQFIYDETFNLEDYLNKK